MLAIVMPLVSALAACFGRKVEGSETNAARANPLGVLPLVVCVLAMFATGVRAAEPTTPEGLTTSEWASIRAAYEAGRHAAYADEAAPGQFIARNPGQQWRTRFDGRGFVTTPDAGGWSWGLDLVSYGRGEAQREICGTAPIINDGTRVSYVWNEALTEWFVNDQRGFEHGYTLRDRPPGVNGAGGAGGEMLTLVLGVRGDLRPQVSESGRDVAFRDGDGNAVVNYNALKVFDADGVELVASFRVIDRAGAPALILTIDDDKARFPITIDPTAQQAYLKAPANPANELDRFATSIAISSDTVVVGAPYEDSGSRGVDGDQANNNATDSGAAYVLKKVPSGWAWQAYLKASNADAGDLFGVAVAISGDRIVVGAPGEDSATDVMGDQSDNSAPTAGAAYVFVRTGTTWAQEAYLKASNGEGADTFGQSVGISGDTVVVGALNENSDATGVDGDQFNENADDAGAAYVFVRGGEGWSQQAYLKASNTDPSDFFGDRVSIWGDTVVVGAHGEDSNATGIDGDQGDDSFDLAGAAYVFVRTGTTWAQQAYVKASNTNAGDSFASDVAIFGDTIVVGASGEDSNGSCIDINEGNNSWADSGAAYVFARSGNIWAQQGFLKACWPDPRDAFGCAVAIADDTIVVGAKGEDSSYTGINTIPISNSGLESGSLNVFIRSGTTWAPQAYIKPSNTGAGDAFGTCVAISNNRVMVGSPLEDSNAMGYNGIQTDNSRLNSGAAYAFVRLSSLGDQWVQQAYLKGPLNDVRAVDVEDHFGAAVAVSGNMVAVGAPGEDSSSTGANGNQADNSATDSGAVYIFHGGGSYWSQTHYLKAMNAEAHDRFGSSVAIHASTIVVGAPGEDSAATGVNGDHTDNSAPESGAAYVLKHLSSGQWTQAYLKGSNTNAGDAFGYGVAATDNTVIVTATGEDGSATGINGNSSDNNASAAGAAYAFVLDGDLWSQQAYVKASNTGVEDRFGASVAASGDTFVIGAPGESSSATGVNSNQMDDSAPDAGAAYVFVRPSGGTWSQQAYLKASNTEQGDWFGGALAVAGDTVVVGAPYEDSNAVQVNGDEGNNAATDAGAAYVFDRADATWSQRSYLKASNAGAGDRFGSSLAIWDSTVVAGAPYEDSGASDTGAVYVFGRAADGANWSHQAFIKASNTGSGDFFGGALATWGRTVVVGAPGEAAVAAGGFSNQGDNTAPGAGAAYLFFVPPCLPEPTVRDEFYACMDGSASIGVTFDGEGPVMYQWRRATVPIDTTNNPSAATANLVLNNVTQVDAVTYDCVVTNPCGSVVTSTTTLILMEDDSYYCSDCPPCFPDYDQNGGVDGGDIGAFFHDFEQGLPCADVDQDGGITTGDIAYFFYGFEQGSC